MEGVEADKDNEQWQKTYSEWQGSVGVQRTDSNANQPYYPSWTGRTCSQTLTALCIYLANNYQICFMFFLSNTKYAQLKTERVIWEGKIVSSTRAAYIYLKDDVHFIIA